MGNAYPPFRSISCPELKVIDVHEFRLTAQGLRKTLRDGERVFELCVPSFTVGRGDKVAIVGASGSGKTTALDMIALASSPDEVALFEVRSGSQTHDHVSMFKRKQDAPLAALRAGNFGYVLQTHSLFPFLTIEENIAISLDLAGFKDHSRIEALLKWLGLDVPLKARPASRSVGQRQRVAVARALAHQPGVLVADEPTSALDPESAERTLNLCVQHQKHFNGAMVLVTHDRGLAERHGFQILPIDLEKLPNGLRGTLRALPLSGAGA